MRIADALHGVRRLFLDSAPLIYHVEAHPAYVTRTRPFFTKIDAGQIEAVTSSISLLECLVLPLRMGDAALAGQFRDRIVSGRHTFYRGVDAVVDSATNRPWSASSAPGSRTPCCRHSGQDG